MKRLTKVMSVVLAFIMLMSMGIYSSAKEQYYRLGDFDLDGEITAADARMVLRAAVGLETLTDFQKLISDYDGNGDISAADARMVLRTCVGLETVIYVDDQGERYGYLEETDTYYPLKDEGYFSYTGQKYDSYDAIPAGTWYIQVLGGVVSYQLKPKKEKEEPHQKYTPETDPYYYMPEIGIWPAYAGLYYDAGGVHVDYEDLNEGDFYWHFDETGACAEIQMKPYVTQEAPDTDVCPICGKKNAGFGKGVYACTKGGCTRWLADHTCEHCGTFVPCGQCHTCP